MAGRNRSKLAMIGIDAGELSFIRSAISSLPNFRRVLDTGVLRRLRSPADLMPGSVWPTFYTGTPPGEHGIYHHLQWDPDSMRLRRVNPDWLYWEPFCWYELERRGLEVIAIDVPMTPPPGLIRGIEIANWGSHDQLTSFATLPQDFAGEIRRRFGRYPMSEEIPVKKTRGQLRKIHSDLVNSARRKAELSRWILQGRQWDFFITVFGECHRGGHILWPGNPSPEATVPANALLDIYQSVGQAMGQILDSLPLDETTVMIFALHGMGPNTSQDHFVPEIMDRVNQQFGGLEQNASSSHAPTKQHGFMRLLREGLPAPLQHALGKAAPVFVRDWVVNRSITAGHDWQRTPGLDLLADETAYLRFNVRGREKHGMLGPESEIFERYVQWMCECFNSCRLAGSGIPLVNEIRFPTKEFAGRRSDYLPDAIVTWPGASPASRIDSEIIGSVTVEPATGRSGSHRPEGFCIVLEPGSERGGEAPPGDLLDLTSMVFQKTLGEIPTRS